MSRKQCQKCPWKVDTNPADIPDGYSVKKHVDLQNTIADGIHIHHHLRIMACHEFPIGREMPCVGWLHNQLGPGNNVMLRLMASGGQISTDYELDGDQHSRFEDTLG